MNNYLKNTVMAMALAVSSSFGAEDSSGEGARTGSSDAMRFVIRGGEIHIVKKESEVAVGPNEIEDIVKKSSPAEVFIIDREKRYIAEVERAVEKLKKYCEMNKIKFERSNPPLGSEQKK